MDNKQNFSLCYIVAVIFIMMAIQSVLMGTHSQLLAYSLPEMQGTTRGEYSERSALLALLGRSGPALNIAA